MANKILVKADSTPIVWASEFDYDGEGGAKTDNIELGALGDNTARAGDVVDLDFGGISEKFPAKFSVTLRMTFENDDKPNAGLSVDLYWLPTIEVTGPFQDGIIGEDAAYTGTTGSTIEESLRQLQFLGSLTVTVDGIEDGVQQVTFIAMLPTQYGVPVLVNNAGPNLANNGEFLSITFTPYEYEVQ